MLPQPIIQSSEANDQNTTASLYTDIDLERVEHLATHFVMTDDEHMAAIRGGQLQEIEVTA